MDTVRPTALDVYGACVCLGLNRAARGVTRRYDHALKPLGLTSGQFSILTALAAHTTAPLSRVAAILGMDRTTLNRNLKPLIAAGLVATAEGADRRVRGLGLTRQGRALFEEAIPVWRTAQAESNRRVGGGRWPELRVLLDSLS